jgi:hypothetical protein
MSALCQKRTHALQQFCRGEAPGREYLKAPIRSSLQLNAAALQRAMTEVYKGRMPLLRKAN